MLGLVDCNNFYVSCERAFNPALENRAVVVLSNNDSCAIARSNEAKSLNIKMGTPFFQLKEIISSILKLVFINLSSSHGTQKHTISQRDTAR